VGNTPLSCVTPAAVVRPRPVLGSTPLPASRPQALRNHLSLRWVATSGALCQQRSAARGGEGAQASSRASSAGCGAAVRTMPRHSMWGSLAMLAWCGLDRAVFHNPASRCPATRGSHPPLAGADNARHQYLCAVCSGCRSVHHVGAAAISAVGRVGHGTRVPPSPAHVSVPHVVPNRTRAPLRTPADTCCAACCAGCCACCRLHLQMRHFLAHSDGHSNLLGGEQQPTAHTVLECQQGALPLS
jgi:hypothetical protein